MDSDLYAHPPQWMQVSNASLADGARKHVQDVQRRRKKLFWKLCNTFSCMKANESEDEAREEDRAISISELPGPIGWASIQFGDMRKDQGDTDGQTDTFRWVALYENQRGLTAFSTAYYSSRTLLPFDPPPFTMPDPGQSTPHIYRGHRTPNVTLDTYSLPDPTWRWVSKSWLVDMRRSGDVGHDGFEYGWHFRGKHWRPHAGWFSAGGLVRHRLWVRLMMRPSEIRLRAEAAMVEELNGTNNETDHRASEGEIGRVWRGDDKDWERLRKVLKLLGRDGPRLDLWADWLSDMRTNNVPISPQHARQWTEDDFTQDRFEMPPAEVVSKNTAGLERPVREWVDTVLREHGRELSKCFVYPDSRSQLRELLVDAGLAEDAARLGPNDFWV